MQHPGLKGPLLWSLLLHSALVRVAGRVHAPLPSRRSMGRRGRRRRDFREIGRRREGVPLPRPESGDDQPRGGRIEGALQVRTQTQAASDRRRKPSRFPNSPKRSSRDTSPARRRRWKTPRLRPERGALRAGGSPAVPYSQFGWARAVRRPAGMQFGGPGGGDFGGRFSWYVDCGDAVA